MPTPCNDCSTSLGIFKRRIKCESCLGFYCAKCFAKSSQMISKEIKYPRSCLKCNVFSVAVFKREDLLLLNTKDLRIFLLSKNISTENCKERYHLVDLIMNFAEQNGQKSLTDIRMEERRREHVENLRLAAQQREEEEMTRNQQNLNNADGIEEEFQQNLNNADRIEEEFQQHFNNADRIEEEFQQNLPGTPLHFSNMTQQWKSIEDITSLDDIDTLSVLQLKKILTVNFIDYKGCFEKKELIERVKTLWTSKQRQSSGAAKSSDDGESVYDENLCKICMDSVIDCVLLECGHLITCTKCGRQLAECPICRRLVSRVVHVFKA